MKVSIFAKYKALLTVTVLFLFFSFACSTSTNVPTKSIPSVAASYTPSSTSSPVPSSTPTLTPTVTATPIPPLISIEGRVVRSEHFDSLSTISFSVDSAGAMETKDGFLILTDPISTTGNPWTDGHVALRSIFSPQVGNVSVFLFKADENTYFGYHFELFENTDAGLYYRGVNLDCCTPGVSWHFDQGYNNNHATQQSKSVTQFKHGVWYFYTLQVHPDGLVTAQLRERDQPNKLIFDGSFQLDDGWTKPGFTFIVAVDQGKMDVDEYQEVELGHVP